MKNFKIKKEDAVLLIIDIQEKLLPAMKYDREVVEATNILIQGAKELDIPVLVTEQYPKGLGSTVESLKNLEGASFFEKTKFSALTQEVNGRIENLARKQVIVMGIETHICVFQTCRDLKELGYDVFVPIEGVSSRTKDNTKNGLNLIKDLGGVVTNVETLLFDLLEDAKSEDFKTISRLIK